MKEREYVEMFVSKPFWANDKWNAWTSQGASVEDGFKIKIPVPEELVKERLEVEVVEGL